MLRIELVCLISQTYLSIIQSSKLAKFCDWIKIIVILNKLACFYCYNAIFLTLYSCEVINFYIIDKYVGQIETIIIIDKYQFHRNL